MLLLLLALPLGWEPEPVPPPPPAAPPPVATKPAAPVVHKTRTVRLAPSYHFVAIENQLKQDQLALTRCFIEGGGEYPARVRLDLMWEGDGILKDLTLVPRTDDKTYGCLSQLVRSWRLPLHPGMKPFSYTAQLVLGGP